MKVIAGDVESLVGLVRKRIDERIGELDASLDDETSQKLARAKQQAKQLRDQIIEQAGRDAERTNKEKLMAANQEAKLLMIQARGRMEQGLWEGIHKELLDFVKGKRLIEGIDYDDLVKSALEEGKKRRIAFKVMKHEDGAVLSSESMELDLRVDSMMGTLRTLPIGEVIKTR